MFSVLKKRHSLKKSKENFAQVLIEFTFCMIILFIMFYSIIMILRWTGIDLAQRRLAHDQLLVQSVVEDYGLCLNVTAFGICLEYDPASYYRGPLGQIDPSFYFATEMNAVWDDTAPHY